MAHPRRRRADLPESTELRIIGGRFRGRKLTYEPFAAGGAPVARPMKHRTREAIFNLISTASEGRHAIDLFAGTGALGLEALSRGAVGCTFIEKHVPTARVVEQNIASLGVREQTALLMTSAFLWGKRDLPKAVRSQGDPDGHRPAIACPPTDVAWLVFCSPPYAFYVDRRDDMVALIDDLVEYMPSESVIVVEADERFDFALLTGGIAKRPKDDGWDVRNYAPAVVGLWQKRVPSDQAD